VNGENKMVTIKDIENLDFGIYNAYYSGHDRPLPVLIGKEGDKTWYCITQATFLKAYNFDYLVKDLEKIELKTVS
jgi:hypothetical protein